MRRKIEFVLFYPFLLVCELGMTVFYKIKGDFIKWCFYCNEVDNEKANNR